MWWRRGRMWWRGRERIWIDEQELMAAGLPSRARKEAAAMPVARSRRSADTHPSRTLRVSVPKAARELGPPRLAVVVIQPCSRFLAGAAGSRGGGAFGLCGGFDRGAASWRARLGGSIEEFEEFAQFVDDVVWPRPCFRYRPAVVTVDCGHAQLEGGGDVVVQ